MSVVAADARPALLTPEPAGREAHAPTTPDARRPHASTPLNVLVLHAELGTLRGGGENFTRNLFAAFAARGHTVTAAFTADPFGHYPFAPPEVIRPVPIRGVWSRSFGQATLSAVNRRLHGWSAAHRRWERLQNGLAWRASYWNNIRFQRRVLRSVETMARGIDAIYVHSNPFLASAIARTHPTILRLPGPLSAESAATLRQVDAVCANGDALVRLRTFLGDDVIELPVDLDDTLFAPGPSSRRSALGWSSEQRVVGYVGRLSRIKGVDILAAAFARLARTRSDVRLLMIGTGEEEGNLRSMLRGEIARGLAVFAGDVSHEQLPEWYRAMDILAMPSRYENYSNAVLEALGCGVPFIGSNVGGNAALFETGAGWLFDASSSSDLAAQLDRALLDREDIVRRGSRGREHVIGRYSWSVSARRLEEILAGVIARRGVTWKQ